MADDREKAIATVKHLVVLLRTLEREWLASSPLALMHERPGDRRLSASGLVDDRSRAYVAWVHGAAVLQALARAVQLTDVVDTRTLAALSGAARHATGVRGRTDEATLLPTEAVQRAARPLVLLAAGWLDGERLDATSPFSTAGCVDVGDVLGRWTPLLVFASFPHKSCPVDEVEIAEAVRRRERSFRKRAATWTTEEKAKSLVRAALAVIGWKHDPFVADRVTRHRAASSIRRKRSSG